MDRFVPQFQGQDWVDGMRVLHVYALPREDVDRDLLALTQQIRPHMQGYPIDPVTSETGFAELHLTLEMIADAPATDIPETERAELVAALAREVAPLPPISTQVGPPLGNVAGVVLDVDPDEEVVVLQDRVRAAVRSARGEAALRHSGGRPHLQAGYSFGTTSSDPLNGVLRNEVATRRAPLEIDRVHLLDVRWGLAGDTGGWRMSWTPVAEVRLEG
ncbi:2'-5' RNA ligase family protein [Streptomyces albidoflavus]